MSAAVPHRDATPSTAWALYDPTLSRAFDVYWRAIGSAYAGRKLQYRIKRGLDVAFALLLLALLSPVLLAIAVCIKLTSRGPILYRQQRLMRGGWSFTLLKFRTMVVGADALVGHALGDPVTGALYKSKRQGRDPRVTAVGRVLRVTFLDELPQLINVLRGEMSFVGPRPCQLHEAEHLPREFAVRFAVPQGLTGPWQIQRHRHQQRFAEQLAIEVAYVDRWSLLEDVRIILRTIPLVLSRAGV